MKSEKKSERVLSLKKEGLSKAARDLLSRVRASPNPEAVYGLDPAAAEAKAWSVINPLVEDTGLPVARLNQYRWYLAELCRLMRTRSGPDLAYCMEFTIRKWLGFGLEPNSVVVLASELFDRLGAKKDPDGSSPPRHQDTKGQEQTKSEGRSQNAEGRSAETGEDLPPRHQDTKGQEQPHCPTGAAEAKSEGRSQSSEVRSADSGNSPDDERCTMNEVTSGGGGP